jgi:hypothetical protein
MRKILTVVCSFIFVIGTCTTLAFHAQEAYAYDDFITVSMKVSPNNLVIHSVGEGDWLTIHVDIPYSVVNCTTLVLLFDNVVLPVKYAKADLRGDLVAKFDLSDIKAIVTPPTETLLLSGYTTAGVQFYGSDIIQVK